MYADKHPSDLRSIDLLSGGTGLLLKISGFSPHYSFFFCSCFFFPKNLASCIAYFLRTQTCKQQEFVFDLSAFDFQGRL
jgi:hypothetical protein